MLETEKWTGERTIWFKPADHLKEFRQINNYYQEAMAYCIDKSVVDVGCGFAFGTFLLSLVAKRVDGYDVRIPGELIEPRLQLPVQCKMTLNMLDLEKEPVPVEADICVAIELIEHLANPEFFLENLKTKSIFFTIPCYGDKQNTFHKIEYSEESAKTLVSKYFPNCGYRMENGHMIGIASK